MSDSGIFRLRSSIGVNAQRTSAVDGDFVRADGRSLVSGGLHDKRTIRLDGSVSRWPRRPVLGRKDDLAMVE